MNFRLVLDLDPNSKFFPQNYAMLLKIVVGFSSDKFCKYVLFNPTSQTIRMQEEKFINRILENL